MSQILTTKLEIKALENKQFEGHGSIFGNVDYGGDVVVPGAFAKTLANHAEEGTLPLMFWSHKADEVPGRWLEMREDSDGLYVKGELADTQLGRDTHTLLKMDAVRGMSIGYQTKDYDYNSEGHRLLKELELFEVSIVSLAMNPKAQIAYAKSRLSERGEYIPTNDELALFKRECEQFFKSKGFSNALAKMYVGNLFKDHANVMLDDPGAMPDEETTDKTNQDSSATPDEIEVNAGLQSFRETQEAYEINQIMKRYFRNG